MQWRRKLQAKNFGVNQLLLETKGKKGGKGKGGKGKGKAHSFEGEGEEEQEWPEGDGQDGEQAGDGDLGFLCVLGPSADSAPARHQPCRNINCHPIAHCQ